MVAAETHGAVGVPCRTVAVGETYVMQRTSLDTTSATGTCIGGVEMRWRREITAEERTKHSALQPGT